MDNGSWLKVKGFKFQVQWSVAVSRGMEDCLNHDLCDHEMDYDGRWG